MDFYKAAFVIILQKSAETLWEFFPYVILGALVSEILKITSWTKLIYRAVSRSPVLSIVTADILGILSPLCTYGTIPVMLELFKAGVHISPLLAFLAASSMMTPQLFIMTWGGLGLEMAVARTVAVFVFSLLIGLLVKAIPQSWVVKASVLSIQHSDEEILSRGPKAVTWKSFLKSFFENLQFVGFYMVLGVVIGAAVEVLVPANWISSLFQSGSWLSVLSAALIGIPLYACGGGVIPLVQSLMVQGMDKGSALAFFIVGPATRINSIFALVAVLRPVFIAAYIVLLILFSLVAGIVY